MIDLKEVASRNGFYEVADLYVVTPSQNSATIFLSRAMRTAPFVSQIESNMVGKDVAANADELKRQLRLISLSKQNSESLFLDEDFLILNMIAASRTPPPPPPKPPPTRKKKQRGVNNFLLPRL